MSYLSTEKEQTFPIKRSHTENKLIKLDEALTHATLESALWILFPPPHYFPNFEQYILTHLCLLCGTLLETEYCIINRQHEALAEFRVRSWLTSGFFGVALWGGG